ncbi:hypothetical protein A2U01_0066574, partial [Trifolium medium]|nr:hypothetical protein [Trifolium medium]
NKKVKTVPETPEEKFEHVTASGNEKSQDKMITGDEEEMPEEHADVNSQSGESKKTVSVDLEDSCRGLDEKKLKIERVIQALKLE